MDSIAAGLPAQGARSTGCPGTHSGELGRGRQTSVRRQPEQSILQGIVGRAGAVTASQRCGSTLNVTPHFHTLVAEGVFAEQGDGSPRFVPLREPPSEVAVARLLARVRGRILRRLRRHDIDLEGSADHGRSDPLALESPVLAQVQGASVIGRVATGPRAGQQVLRMGSDPTAPQVTTGGPRHAHREGFDLHANVAGRAGEDERLEQLCRYILRPPVAQDAPEVTPGGKVVLRLRRPWRDGTRALCFEPSEFLEKLAAVIPRPRINLLVCHGAFAPRGRCHRGPVVVDDSPYRVPPPTGGSAGAAGDAELGRHPLSRRSCGTGTGRAPRRPRQSLPTRFRACSGA